MQHSLSDLFMNCLYAEYFSNKDNVSYAFIEENDSLYIYFQCSYTKMDWLHNFMFSKRPYKGMETPYRVHRGFLKCWKTIEDIIIDRITEKVSDCFKYNHIYVIGYSHGAALAMLCHECCWFHRNDISSNIKTLAFEGPRVYGGYRIKEDIKERWKNFRIFRNDTDIVTHLPPYVFGYTHAGEIIHIGEGKEYGMVSSHKPENVLTSLKELSYNEKWEDILFESGD